MHAVLAPNVWYTSNATDAFVRMPIALRTLHALPPFPKVVNYLDAVDGYPRHDPDRVSSRNELKPENILFDGHRIWLVDWEVAS